MSSQKGFLIEVADAVDVATQAWWDQHLPAVLGGMQAVMSGQYWIMHLSRDGVRCDTEKYVFSMMRPQIKQWGREGAEKAFEIMKEGLARGAAERAVPKVN